VPVDPADPQAAALALIVALPSSLSARLADAAKACVLTEILRDYCGALQVGARAFDGLSWADAKPIAAPIPRHDRTLPKPRRQGEVIQINAVS
jgi:hypothetical protein